MFRRFYTTAMCPQRRALEKRFRNIQKAACPKKLAAAAGGMAALVLLTSCVFTSGMLQDSALPKNSGTPAPAGATGDEAVTTEADLLQESVDNGHQPWRLDIEQVAMDFVRRDRGITQGGTWEVQGESRVIFRQADGYEMVIDLYQPAKKGEGGIWEVEHWFDEDSGLHQVRDLTALPPLFHNDDTIPENYRRVIRQTVVQQFTDAYTPYYEVLGFEASGTTFTQNGNRIEATFLLTMASRNYYKDPDTVNYIKEAKENNSPYYEQLRREYNEPRTANYNLKVEGELDASGSLSPDSIALFYDSAPTGTPDWRPITEIFPQ